MSILEKIVLNTKANLVHKKAELPLELAPMNLEVSSLMMVSCLFGMLRLTVGIGLFIILLGVGYFILSDIPAGEEPI